MKTIILILLLTSLSFSQSELLTLFDSGINPYVIENMEVTRYSAALTTALPDSQLQNIDNLVSMLKDSLGIDSLPQKFDFLYVMANADSVSSKLNLVKRAHDGVVFGTTTFTQWEGWTGNGSDGYINSNYNPTTGTVTYTQNSGSFGFVSRKDSIIANMATMGGATVSNRIIIYLRQAGDLLTYRSNTATAVTFANTTSRGIFIVSRTGATASTVYRDGALLVDSTATSLAAGLPNLNMYVGAYNANGTAGNFDSRCLSFAFMGAGFDDIEARKVSNCFEAYLDSIGKGVIP